MLRSLRLKFIVINMAMAVLVLFTSFFMVCYINYIQNLNAIYSQLNLTLSSVISASIPQIEGIRPISGLDDIAESPDANGLGEVNDKPAANEGGASDGSQGSQDTQNSQKVSATTSINAFVYDEAQLVDMRNQGSSSNSAIAPNIGAEYDPGVVYPKTILIAVYEVANNGIYTTMPHFSNASITESVLLRADNIVLETPDNRGILSEQGLCFMRMPTDNGYIVAYADASSLNEWKQLALMLVGVGILALVAFFLINILFSRWALRPVRISMQKQRQFTADASHELKTPLTVILANMSILESEQESTVAEQMQWIESTQTEAERMQLLVNDMLNAVRPREDQVQQASIAQEDVDLSDVVEGEVLQFESVAFERGVNLDAEIDPEIHVLGDAERLGRMVATLIDNACKYTGENGEVKVRLVERRSSAKPYAKLTVHNNGEPISEKDLPNLFDRFYRADKARTSGKGGYGLGLAIGREIAIEHKGEISATSSAEEGTTFTVKIPIIH